MNREDQILGLVQNGRFLPLAPESGGPIRLTTIQMVEAQPPDSGELDLKRYEGKSIMVSYHGGGGEWLYSAKVIDEAGPIITELVGRVSEIKSKEAAWGWKKSTDPDDAWNFINGTGAYQYPVKDFRICAVWKTSYIEFYIFYTKEHKDKRPGDWGWKKAMDIDDAWNFINGTGAYQHPVKDFRICAVNKESFMEFYIFYRR